MSDDIQRTLGEHGAKLESIGYQVSQMGSKLDQLIASENKRLGERKVVWMIAAAAGALASGLADAFSTRFLK